MFYVSEEGFDVFDGKGGVQKCNYLEVSKVEVGKTTWCPCPDKSNKKIAKWCSVNTGDGVGYGKSNTYKITAASHGVGLTASNCAAFACYNYSTATTKKGEWFLPSKEELNLLYNANAQKIRDGASSYEHWSSSQIRNNEAWHKSFSPSSSGAFIVIRSTDANDDAKNCTYAVRAVRAFGN